MQNINKYERYYRAIIQSLQLNTSLFTLIAVLTKSDLHLGICITSCIAFVSGLFVKPIVCYFGDKIRHFRKAKLERKLARIKSKEEAVKPELSTQKIEEDISMKLEEYMTLQGNSELEAQMTTLRTQIHTLEKMQDSINKFADFTDKKNLVTQIQDAYNEGKKRINQNTRDILTMCAINSTGATNSLLKDIEAELFSNAKIISNLRELMLKIGKAATQQPETDEIANLGFNASVQALNQMYDTSGKAL